MMDWISVCSIVHIIHVELATDLTTDGFLNGLKLFIFRRDKPSSIFSDNGLNFVGVKNNFCEPFKLLFQTPNTMTLWLFYTMKCIQFSLRLSLAYIFSL